MGFAGSLGKATLSQCSSNTREDMQQLPQGHGPGLTVRPLWFKASLLAVCTVGTCSLAQSLEQ